jgi:hypothetical protein
MRVLFRKSGSTGTQNPLGLIIGFDKFTLSCLELEHLKEIGDHCTVTIKPIEKDLCHSLHDLNASLGILLDQFPKNISIDGVCSYLLGTSG